MIQNIIDLVIKKKLKIFMENKIVLNIFILVVFLFTAACLTLTNKNQKLEIPEDAIKIPADFNVFTIDKSGFYVINGIVLCFFRHLHVM